jgi:hypothetical protein
MKRYNDKFYCPYWKCCMEGCHCELAITHEVITDAKSKGEIIDELTGRPECFENVFRREDGNIK